MTMNQVWLFYLVVLFWVDTSIPVKTTFPMNLSRQETTLVIWVKPEVDIGSAWAERGSQLILCSCGAGSDVKRVCVLLNV